MKRHLILISILSLIVFSSNINGLSIYILDEAKNATCAREMLQSENIFFPTFNGELRTDKPPLHYFFMMAAYAAGGAQPLTARLFSALMGMALIIITYLTARKALGETPAFISSLILISSIQVAVQFHLAVPDPYLLFLLALSWFSFYMGVESNRNFLYVFYMTTGLATLTKGPVAIVFTGILAVIYLVATKRFTIKRIKKLRLIEGTVLFSLIAFPWYIFTHIETSGQWTEGFFFKHNIGRFTKTMEGHGGFPFLPFLITMIGMMPFALFSVQAVVYAWRRRNEHRLLLFSLIASFIVLLFFSFSKTMLPTYPEPAYAFVAILLGYFFSRPGAPNTSDKCVSVIYLLITIALPVAAWYGIQSEEGIRSLKYLSIYFVILTGGAVAGMIFIWRASNQAAVYAYAAGNIIFLIVFFYFIFPAVDKENPVLASEHLWKGNSLYYYESLNPAFVFRYGQSIPAISKESVSALAEGSIIISTNKYSHDLETTGLIKIFERRNLFERGTTVLFQKK